MPRSEAVKQAMLQFYDRLASGDAEAVGDIISAEEDALVIGTDWDQWEDGRDAWISAYTIQTEETPQFRIEPGSELRGYEEGLIGWAADRPHWVFADGTAIPIRATAVFRQEAGTWTIVQLHVSLGVPDERLEELLPLLLA
jgi:hypothetical protein